MYYITAKKKVYYLKGAPISRKLETAQNAKSCLKQKRLLEMRSFAPSSRWIEETEQTGAGASSGIQEYAPPGYFENSVV